MGSCLAFSCLILSQHDTRRFRIPTNNDDWFIFIFQEHLLSADENLKEMKVVGPAVSATQELFLAVVALETKELPCCAPPSFQLLNHGLF